MAVTGKNKGFRTLYGRKGKRYAGISVLAKDTPNEAGSVVFDDWMLDATASGVTCTASVTSGRAILAASGTAGSSGVTGTLSSIAGNSTLAASGALTVSGALVKAAGDASLSASGTLTVSGALAKTSGNSALNASGSPVVSGTSSVISGNSSLSASGGSALAGTLAVNSGNATLNASGSPIVSGSLAANSGNATVDASGTAGSSSVTGTLNAIAGDSSLAASGGLEVIGSLGITTRNSSLNAIGTAGIPDGITCTLVEGIHSATDAGSYATAPYTFKAGKLYLLCIATSVTAAPNVTVSSVTGTTAVFTQITTRVDSGNIRRSDIWRYVPSVDTTETITALLSGVSTGVDMVLVEIDGADTTGVNGANAIANVAGASVNSTTNALVTLPAFAKPENRPFAFITHRAQEATTPGTNFVEIDDGNHAAPVMGSEVMFAPTVADTTCDASWVTSSNYIGIALEIAIKVPVVPVIPTDSVGGGGVTDIVRNLRRGIEYRQRQKEKAEAIELLRLAEESQAFEPVLKKIVDEAKRPVKVPKEAYQDTLITKKALQEAEQRLLLFLERQELEIQQHQDDIIMRIIAELL